MAETYRSSGIILLYIDLRLGQTGHSKVIRRKEVTHSDGSYEKKSRRQNWLKKWDKVKSHGTLIDWCTGREWPVNCMTVISAWWRSNMPYQRLSRRLNYYITRWDRKSVSWRSEELETWCGRESHHPAEGAFGTPDCVWRPVGEKMLGWEHVPERLGPQAPRWAVQENENDTRRCPEGLGGQYVAVFVQSPTPSHTHKPYNKVRGILFFKEGFARLYSLSQYIFRMYMCIVVTYDDSTIF